MKRIIFKTCGNRFALSAMILISSSIGLATIQSCSSDEEAVADVYHSSNILKILHDYNGSIVNVQSRDIGWVGWLSVAIADGKGAYDGAKLGAKVGALFGPKGAVAGAAVGGAVVGGAASYTQYKMAERITEAAAYANRPLGLIDEQVVAAGYGASKDSIRLLDYNLGLSVGLDSCSIKIAICHNKILDVVEDIQFENDGEQTLQNLDEIELQIVNSKEFETGYNRIVSMPMTYDYDPNLKPDNIMELFIDAVFNSCKSQSDLNQIITYYTSAVKESSELTKEEKEWLFAGFAVMGYSFQYWSEKRPYNP